MGALPNTEWLADSGLQVMERRDLAPVDGGTAKLTVSVWLARRPQDAVVPADSVATRKLERTS